MSAISLPLLRVPHQPKDVSFHFAHWVKKQGVMMRGYARIGTHQRSGLRGLIAAKTISKDESIVTVPSKAMLSFTTAMKDVTFRTVFEESDLPQPISVLNMAAKFSNTFIYRSHMVQAMHMTHVHLLQDGVIHPYVWYFNFLPRGEGDFRELTEMLTSIMENSDECTSWLQALSRRHSNLPIEDLRLMVAYFLTMLGSRSLPISHAPIVEALLAGTEFSEILTNKALVVEFNPNEPLSVPVMCPILDMCNHHPENNAEVAVPKITPIDPVILVRATRQIEQGEEIFIRYKSDELELMYGMKR